MKPEKPEKLLKRISSIDCAFADKLAMALEIDKGNFEVVRKNLSTLRSLDTEILANEAITKYQIPSYFIQAIEILRNTLVLVPIALTWLSLSFAVPIFSTQSPSDNNSFLVLWEQGFGGRIPDILRFSKVATMDAAIVGIVILITLFINIKTNVIDEANLKKGLTLKQDTDNLIMEIEGSLYKKYAALAPTEESNLEAIVVQFEKLASNVETQNKGMLNFVAAEEGRLSTHSVMQAKNIQELQNAATTFYQAASEIVNTIHGLKSSLAEWNDNSRNNNQLLEKSISKNDSMYEKIQELTVGMNSFTQTIQGFERNQSSSISDLNKSIQLLNQSNEKNINFLGKTIMALTGTIPSSISVIQDRPAVNEIDRSSTVEKPLNSDSVLINLFSYISFVPILGFIFGTVTIIWGIVVNKNIKNKMVLLGMGGWVFNCLLIVGLIIAGYFLFSSKY